MLLNLRDVPDDEADALRRALEAEQVDYYELPPSAFGISAGSIWIRDEIEYSRARDVFERAQDDYAHTARAARAVPSFVEHFRAEPGRVIGHILAAILVLLLISWPILELWN